MTHIWYEVFPLTLVEQNAMLLQDTTHSGCSPWMLAHQPNIHPNTVVLEYLTRRLGGLVDAGQSIVHSTSWRYEAGHDWMLLTYLAILPQNDWQVSLQHMPNLMLEPVGEIATQYGDHLFPPRQIERQHVLSHALDHLASLNTYDPVIQATLEAAWQEILRPRQPRPAGCLQRSPIFPASPLNPACETALSSGI